MSQNGQAIGSAGRTGPAGMTGASHSGQAIVAVASSVLLRVGRSSSVPPEVPIGSRSMRRWNAIAGV